MKSAPTKDTDESRAHKHPAKSGSDLSVATLDRGAKELSHLPGGAMNPARENILRRVRAALAAPAPRPPAPPTAPIWPPPGDLEQKFRAEFAMLKGELIETPEALAEFLAGFDKIATDGSAIVRQALGESRPECSARAADLGVTGCDCLIAQTGSVVVSAPSAGGRVLSVLPPVHLVLARRDQLVPDLAAALALLRQRYGARWPSNLTVISGPSRTADIEKVLVMGAHGPKRLAVGFMKL
jgi:L-lactate dehydrogenase complex protein LldG